MRLKTLNGAPLCEHLDFSGETLLESEEYDSIFRGFVDGKTARLFDNDDGGSIVAKWRHLDARPTRLRTGWSQPYLPTSGIYNSNGEMHFLTTPDMGIRLDSGEEPSHLHDTTRMFDEDTTTNDEYLQHSLIFHDTLMSSQIALDASQASHNGIDNTISSSSFLSTSFDTATTEGSNVAEGESEPSVLQLPDALAVTFLKNIPDAEHLRSIYPQTPTPTFLCVLTGQVEQRQVITKKGGYKLDLLEITVADDTDSGFKISFWFRPGRPQYAAQESLRNTLEQLKVGAIVLLRNIVLNIFRETVYGQSLSPKISKARTTVQVLTRADGSSIFKHITPLVVDEKFVKVKKWAKLRVAPDHDGSKKRRGDTDGSNRSSKRSLKNVVKDDDTLPPDTMEAC